MLKRFGSYLLSVLLLTLILSNSAFAQTDKKVAYGILVDNTGSLRSQFDEVLMIAKGIVARTHGRGPISLFNFETQGMRSSSVAVITGGTEWSQDRNLLEDYIDDLYVVAGQTTLMDAINSMAGQLDAKVNPDKGAYADKMIFLISDGEDRGSKIKEKDLIKMLKESGIKVYAVGLTKDLNKNRGLFQKGTKDKSENFLERITKETGGRVVFLTSKNNDTSSLLDELFAK